MKNSLLAFIAILLGVCSAKGQDAKLSGTVIGTEKSVDYGTNTASTTVNTRECAFDGNLNTYFAAYDRSYAWVRPNMLLNVFFGPVANAAQAAASQAQNAIGQFSRNFQVAINPQITKTYASEQLEEMHLLIFRGSKLTFCLLLLLCLPLIVEAPMVLGLWLKEVPEGTVVFLRLLLVILLVQQTASPLITSIAATGKIKKYEMITGGLMLTIVPVAYVVLKMGGAPWSVFTVYLCIAVLTYMATLRITLPPINLSLKDYLSNVLRPCAIVLTLSLIVPVTMKLVMGPSLLSSLLTIAGTTAGTGTLCYYIGLDREMRNLVKEKILSILGKKSV